MAMGISRSRVVEEGGSHADAAQGQVQAPSPLQAEDLGDVARQLEDREPAGSQHAAELGDVRRDRVAVRDVLQRRDDRVDEVEALVVETSEVTGCVDHEARAGDVGVEPARLLHHALGDVDAHAFVEMAGERARQATEAAAEVEGARTALRVA